MNILLDIQILAVLLVGLGVLELVPAIVALGYGEAAAPYCFSAALALLMGIPIALQRRRIDRRLRPRDGFFVVTAAWVMVSVFGSVPYVLSGVLGPVDALFEAVAGFTTTGSTVLTNIEAAPHGLLLWRSLTQWLGGMGIIVLTVAVLPLLGIGGMQLFNAEVPGPITGKLTPRIADTARRLWFIYVGLTVAAFVSLSIAGMDFFDAICHALTAVSTGGFSTRNASIAAFESPAIEWVMIVFMFVAGMNFVLHYRILSGRGRTLLGDDEFRFYTAVVLLMVAAVALSLLLGGVGLEVRAATFQVVSVLTTTGYASADYETWPMFSQLLILYLLAFGGMAGSTAGGLKMLRILIALRVVRQAIEMLPHRKAIRSLRYAGRPVPDNVVTGIFVFIIAYFAIAALGSTVVAGAGYDIATAMSAGFTSIGNVGPGAGEIGPTDHFAHFPAYVKLVLCFCMLAGRLEILTVLALAVPRFWGR